MLEPGENSRSVSTHLFLFRICCLYFYLAEAVGSCFDTPFLNPGSYLLPGSSLTEFFFRQLVTTAGSQRGRKRVFTATMVHKFISSAYGIINRFIFFFSHYLQLRFCYVLSFDASTPSQWLWVVFVLLFLTAIVYLCHLLDIRACSSSSISFFFGPFVLILLVHFKNCAELLTKKTTLVFIQLQILVSRSFLVNLSFFFLLVW